MAVKKRRTPGPRVDRPADHRSTIALLDQIRNRTLDPALLTTEQRRSCVAVLANGQHTTAQLAHLFGVAASTITKDVRIIRETIGEEVKAWSLEHVLGDLAMTAERCSAMAFEQQDPGLAWKIKSEMVDHLRKLGVMGERREQEGLRITVESIGDGYSRLRESLALAMDPALTGEEPENEIEVEATTRDRPPGLGVEGREPDPPECDS